MTEENIHGKYAAAMKHLAYIANRTEVDEAAVNKLLALGHHEPRQAQHNDLLVREMLKGAQQ